MSADGPAAGDGGGPIAFRGGCAWRAGWTREGRRGAFRDRYVIDLWSAVWLPEWWSGGSLGASLTAVTWGVC